MKFVLGKKLRMSEIFGESGEVSPMTLIEAGPIIVAQIKTKEKDGYNALQVGFGEKKWKSVKKSQKGALLKNLGEEKGLRWMREFRVSDEDLKNYKVGDEIKVDVFKQGDLVKATGVSKGKGFQGGVKRWGMKGGPRTHGQKHSEREIGSIGSIRTGKIRKGKRMPGRTGGKTITIKNLKVLLVDSEKNTLGLGGAVPGPTGGMVKIQSDR